MRPACLLFVCPLSLSQNLLLLQVLLQLATIRLPAQPDYNLPARETPRRRGSCGFLHKAEPSTQLPAASANYNGLRRDQGLAEEGRKMGSCTLPPLKTQLRSLKLGLIEKSALKFGLLENTRVVKSLFVPQGILTEEGI